MPHNSMGFTRMLRGASEASQSVSDAVFQHADAIQHLAEALEEEVSHYTQELAARIALLHDSAGKITSAGLEIARAGDRIALCGEHLALGMQQMVIVIAASMLTVVTGLVGWRYFVLGWVCLWLCGFEITRRQSSPPPGPQTQEHPQQQQQHQQQQGSPNGAAPQHLHSALHNPAAGSGVPKRVSFEQGADGSQGTTDSGLPTPHSEQAQSARIADLPGHQDLDGVYVSSDAASGTPHPAAAAVAAAADGDGMGVSGDTAPATSTDGGMPATLQAAQDLAAQIREHSTQIREQQGRTSGMPQ